MPENNTMEPGDAGSMWLAVMDADDLAVVSALLQDAEAPLAEMAYLPRQKRFALVMSRFDWPLAAKGQFVRCSTGLHFDHVLAVARSGWPQEPDGHPLHLIAIAFLPTTMPSGQVLLTFLGGAQIRLTVECLQGEMRDIGPRWTVAGKPAGFPADLIENPS